MSQTSPANQSGLPIVPDGTVEPGLPGPSLGTGLSIGVGLSHGTGLSLDTGLPNQTNRPVETVAPNPPGLPAEAGIPGEIAFPGNPVATNLPLETVHDIRDHCLCLAAQRAARRLARRFDRLFAPLGVTNGQFSLMVALSGGWQPRLGELAEFLAMDATTMTAAIKTLERQGLVTLTADTKDARARRPSLTDTGRSVVSTAVPLWRSEHAKVQAELVGHDAKALARVLGQLG
jgi:DNA-binding MarR family transcriptional regulator